MKSISILGLVAILSWPALAETGDLTYKACDPGQGLSALPLYAQYTNFAASAGEPGLVNPKATIATLKAGDVTIKAAIDSAKPDTTAPDTLRLDFTGQGKFDGAPTVLLKKIERNGSQETYLRVDPTEIKVEVGGTTIPVKVAGQYMTYNNGRYRYLTLTLGACAEGTCDFGGKALAVRLIDGTGNLKFTDAATPRRGPMGDTVLVSTGKTFTGPAAKAFYGQPILVEGTWYNVTVSEDGKKVSAAKADIETGQVKIAHDSWTLRLVGKKYVLVIEGGKEPVAIPADTYTITQYQQPIELSPKVSSMMVAYANNPQSATLEIAAGKTVDLAIGTPLQAKLTAQVAKGAVTFSLTQKDAAGLTVGGIPDITPKVVVCQGDKEVYKGSMEFG